MMYYALYKPVDGKQVGWRPANGPEDITNPGEVVVQMPDDEDPAGKAWDAAAGKLRQRTGAESLDEAKAAKRLEIRRAAFSEQDTHLAPGYEDRDYIHIILAALQNKPDPRQTPLLNIKTKLDGKLAQIEAATTEAAVQAITWP